MSRILLVLALLGGVVGCATPYQAVGLPGGFSEMKRGDNVYLVRFQGNGYTSATQVEEMAFLRAAELTIERGFTYFTILDERATTDRSQYSTPSTTRITAQANAFGGFTARAVTQRGVDVDVTKHQSRVLIGVSNDKLPGYSWITAAEMVGELGPKYRRPSPTSAPKPGEPCFQGTDGKCAHERR